MSGGDCGPTSCTGIFWGPDLGYFSPQIWFKSGCCRQGQVVHWVWFTSAEQEEAAEEEAEGGTGAEDETQAEGTSLGQGARGSRGLQ